MFVTGQQLEQQMPDATSRSSWVVWEEDSRYPDLIIELLSEITAEIDRNLQKNLYKNRFHTPEDFWFSSENLEFAGFELVANKYQDTPNARGWRWSDVLRLYLGGEGGKLRYTPDGDLVPTPEEAAIAALQQASEAQLWLEQEQLRLQRLAEHLRSLGVNSDSLS